MSVEDIENAHVDTAYKLLVAVGYSEHETVKVTEKSVVTKQKTLVTKTKTSITTKQDKKKMSAQLVTEKGGKRRSHIYKKLYARLQVLALSLVHV
jgi:hypothetical protein